MKKKYLKLEKLSENSSQCSMGYLYSQVTEYLGMKPFEHEFKVMGMAPYGKNEDVERIYYKIKHLLKLDSNGQFISHVTSNLYKYELYPCDHRNRSFDLSLQYIHLDLLFFA